MPSCLIVNKKENRMENYTILISFHPDLMGKKSNLRLTSRKPKKTTSLTMLPCTYLLG